MWLITKPITIKIAGLSSDGSGKKTACCDRCCLWYGTYITDGSSEGGEFFLLVLYLLLVLLLHFFFCFSLCWLVLCLIYTVLSLMILSVLSFSWFCGPIKDYNYDMLKFLWTTLSSHLQINISMHFFSLWLQKVSDFNFSLKKGFNFNNN